MARPTISSAERVVVTAALDIDWEDRGGKLSPISRDKAKTLMDACARLRKAEETDKVAELNAAARARMEPEPETGLEEPAPVSEKSEGVMEDQGDSVAFK